MNDFLPLPAAMLQRARDFRGEPATTRVAATVAMLRDTPTGPQVYVLRRRAAMVFGGVHAFPGGSVDPTDSSLPVGPGDGWAQRWGVAPEAARAVVGAAVREVFEETGVLLAGTGTGNGTGNGTGTGTDTGDAGEAPDEADRSALIRGECTLAEVLARRGARLRDDLLAPWSRWITPEFEPRRFDTYFFVAALPDGREPRDVSGEADDTMWITPADALAGYADGSLGMLPPTVATLRDLAAYGRVEEVFAAAADRDLGRPITPWLEFTADGGARLRVTAQPAPHDQPKRPVM